MTNANVTLFNQAFRFDSLSQQPVDRSLDSEAFHAICLQLRGVHVPTADRRSPVSPEAGFGEIHLRLPPNERRGLFSVPKKIPVVEQAQTPYTLLTGRLMFRGSPVFGDDCVREVPLPERGVPRYLKGYSFPFLGTDHPFHELRINPKNTGRCPGRCVFCHRQYSFRERPAPGRGLLTPGEIVDAILREFGTDAFRQVSHISVITELFGSESAYLLFLEHLREALARVTGSSPLVLSACAQDIRSEDGLRRLLRVVSPRQYSYTLEVFSARQRVMGRYKGISLDRVERCLTLARQVGFERIKVNYVCGIDDFATFERGFRRLRSLGLVDMVGLSVFTAFFRDQLFWRHPSAWEVRYYLDCVELIKELGLSFYKPHCFEMGLPLSIL